MEVENSLDKLLSCMSCNKKFNKENKPLIMFCGHNICEECKLANRGKIKCQICGKIFSKREIKKFPINYSILENKLLSQGTKKEEKKSENNDEKNENKKEENSLDVWPDLNKKNSISFLNVLSGICNYISNNEDEIKSLENNKNKPKETEAINKLKNETKTAIDNTFKLIDDLEKNFLIYSQDFLNIMIKGINIVNKNDNYPFFDNLNLSELLLESGLINYGDYFKLEKFIKLFDVVDKNKLKNCSSFKDIYNIIKEKNDKIEYKEFMSLFFFFNKLFEMKIKKLDVVLNEQKNIYTDLSENKQNMIHLITNLGQKFEMKLSDLFYDSTFYKTSHFIFDINKNKEIFSALNEKLTNNNTYNKIFLVYEPIEKKIKYQEIKIDELNNEEIIDSLLIINKYLYILTNKQFYEYNLLSKEHKKFPNSNNNQNIDMNSKIFKYDTSIMKISTNSFDCINLRDDISKNDWRSLSLYENTLGKLVNPYPICHGSNLIYVLEEGEKLINNIYLYNADEDSWKKKEIKLETKTDEENEKNEELVILKKLYLEKYYFFDKCYACIFGGQNPNNKKFNKNVFAIDPIKGIIKKIICFDEFITDDMIVLECNCSILNKTIDFVFIYHFLNKENEIKIKIIRKEILENDISVKSDLKVIINENLNECSLHDKL